MNGTAQQSAPYSDPQLTLEEMLVAMQQGDTALRLIYSKELKRWYAALEASAPCGEIRLNGDWTHTAYATVLALYDRWYALTGANTAFNSALLGKTLPHNAAQPENTP